MCNKRTSSQISIADRSATFISCTGDYKKIKVDHCMVQIIQFLNRHGIETVACCCGHNRYPMTIVVTSPNGIRDIFSNEVIPRKRKYYRLDKKGYFYIPEVSDAKP